MTANQDIVLEKDKREAIHQYLSLLNNLNIEEAIETFMKPEVEIIYNGKRRLISKFTWLKFLKKNVLNKFTSIVQFKITNVRNNSNKTMFNIHMICKRFNGNLFFTEIKVQNNWNNNSISQTIYTSTNY